MTQDGITSPRTQTWVPAELPPGLQRSAPTTAPPTSAGDPPPWSPPPRQHPAPPHWTPPQAAAPYGPAYYAPPTTPTPVLAIVGLVLAVVLAPVGLIVSIVAWVQSRRTGVGRGLAIAGVVVSCVPIVLAVAIPLFLNARAEGSAADARAAYRTFETALLEADCDAYMARTTENLRQHVGVTTCPELEALTATITAHPEAGHVQIVDLTVSGHVATLTTAEAAAAPAGGQSQTAHVQYNLVLVGGKWRVDTMTIGP